jgi:hypothetical protein
MNTSCRRQKPETSRPEISLFWCLVLTIPLAFMILVCVIFPGKNGPFELVALDLGFNSPVMSTMPRAPKAHVQADARTFVEGLRWLFQPDSEPLALPVNRDLALAWTNPVLPPLPPYAMLESSASGLAWYQFAPRTNLPPRT